MSTFPQNSAVVLVNGAWRDGSCWSHVILPLQRQGLKVICAPIPPTSLTDDIAALTRAIERTNGPVFLARHAYGGAVIAGPKDSGVQSLVYGAALAPAENETVADVLCRAKPHPEARNSTRMHTGSFGCPKGGSARGVAHNALPDQAAILEAVQRPVAVKCVQEKARVPAWKSKPSGYLLAEEHRMIVPETLRYMTERMGAKICLHWVENGPMHTAPDVIIGVCLEASQETFAY